MKKRNDFLSDPKFKRPQKEEKPSWDGPSDEGAAPKRPAKAGGKKKYTRLSDAFPELDDKKKSRAKADRPASRPKVQRGDDRQPGREAQSKPSRSDGPRSDGPRSDGSRDGGSRNDGPRPYEPRARRDDERKPRREESAYKPKRSSSNADRVFNKPTLKRSDFERLQSPDYQPTKFERNRHEDSPPRGDRPGSDRERPGRRDVKSSDAFRSRPEERDDDRPSRRDEERPAREARSPRGSRPERKERYNPRADRREQDEKEKQATEGENRRVGKFTRPPRYDFSGYEDKKPRSRQKEDFKKHEDDDVLRLNRYIANAGICSRREADELIASGQITVNGELVTEMGFKVKRSDAVKYGKKLLNPEKLVYLLINKPKDYITTTDDPEERRTVMDLVAGACAERIYPVGRLDRNTTGLLLLTNDGELAKKLTHPSSNIKKIYQVELDKPITTEDFEKLKEEGVELEGRPHQARRPGRRHARRPGRRHRNPQRQEPRRAPDL